MRNVFVLLDGTSLVLADKSNIQALHSVSQAAGCESCYQPGIGAFLRVGATIDQWLAPNLEPQALYAYQALEALGLTADDRLFIFGYSRGAVTARTLAMCIASGEHLVEATPRSSRGPRFNASISARIEFLCIYDPVVGWPRVFGSKVQNHDAILELKIQNYVELLSAEETLPFFPSDTYSRSKKTSKRIAAISSAEDRDDRINSFDALALRKTRKVVWFPGSHADVGGHGNDGYVGAHSLATALQELMHVTDKHALELPFPAEKFEEIRQTIQNSSPSRDGREKAWRQKLRSALARIGRRSPQIGSLIPHFVHPICDEYDVTMPNDGDLPRFACDYLP